MTISNQTVERCIEECLQCSRWCAQCRTESLDQDPIMMRDCIVNVRPTHLFDNGSLC
jgi:hypothetical protein